MAGDQVKVPVLSRGSPELNGGLTGPLVIEQPDTTIFVPPAWQIRSLPTGSLLMTPVGK
jgi:N-methylhydantoinase A/oxoprolinase/acetone carboxylase beta subunit